MTQRSVLTPGFRWSPRAGRYIGPDGRFVPARAVRGALDAVIGTAGDGMQQLTRDLAAGRLTLAEWQGGMAQQLRLLHTASAAAAAGGWAQMQPADWGRVGQALRSQYRYLQAFAADIETGAQPLDGRAAARAQLYAEAARPTYEAQARATARRAGATEEANVLGPADHCGDCLAATAAGWQPLGTLPPIGARVCLVRCRCTLIYR